MTTSSSLMQTFYYSRRKLGLYLLFNCGLLLLALLFTWMIFPDYTPVYRFAIAACTISAISALLALLIRHPLAVITPESIRIDFCQPLKWKDIAAARKITIAKYYLGKREYKRNIIIFDVPDLSKYKLNFMQKLSKNSEFSAFSIPLYAMDDKEAGKIEKLIRRQIKK